MLVDVGDFFSSSFVPFEAREAAVFGDSGNRGYMYVPGSSRRYKEYIFCIGAEIHIIILATDIV